MLGERNASRKLSDDVPLCCHALRAWIRGFPDIGPTLPSVNATEPPPEAPSAYASPTHGPPVRHAVWIIHGTHWHTCATHPSRPGVKERKKEEELRCGLRPLAPSAPRPDAWAHLGADA